MVKSKFLILYCSTFILFGCQKTKVEEKQTNNSISLPKIVIIPHDNSFENDFFQETSSFLNLFSERLPLILKQQKKISFEEFQKIITSDTLLYNAFLTHVSRIEVFSKNKHFEKIFPISGIYDYMTITNGLFNAPAYAWYCLGSYCADLGTNFFTGGGHLAALHSLYTYYNCLQG